ncbi:MAG: DNA-deoxyinosine glycosylase [Thiotrichales bacterium]
MAVSEIAQGFPPIADSAATILVLGSMPGAESLRQNAYYAHPRNAFWPIMGRLLGFDPAATYVERTAALTHAGVALWDVLRACERSGSLDARIIDASIVVNDFAKFFQRHPRIDRVFFNGARADQEFRRRVLPLLPARGEALALHRLPSTSPALAQLSFEQKLAAWRTLSASLKRP